MPICAYVISHISYDAMNKIRPNLVAYRIHIGKTFGLKNFIKQCGSAILPEENVKQLTCLRFSGFGGFNDASSTDRLGGTKLLDLRPYLNSHPAEVEDVL